jgi:hypothetical protein
VNKRENGLPTTNAYVLRRSESEAKVSSGGKRERAWRLKLLASTRRVAVFAGMSRESLHRYFELSRSAAAEQWGRRGGWERGGS